MIFLIFLFFSSFLIFVIFGSSLHLVSCPHIYIFHFLSPPPAITHSWPLFFSILAPVKVLLAPQICTFWTHIGFTGPTVQQLYHICLQVLPVLPFLALNVNHFFFLSIWYKISHKFVPFAFCSQYELFQSDPNLHHFGTKYN